MNLRCLLGMAAGLLFGFSLSAHADVCTLQSYFEEQCDPCPPGSPLSCVDPFFWYVPVFATQTVMVNVLPISVTYAPPGVCNGSSSCPSQKLKSSQSFGTKLSLTSSTQSTETNAAGITISTGSPSYAFSGRLSLTFEQGTTTGSSTTNSQQSVHVDTTSLNASLRPSDNWLDFQPTGSKPGDRDVIAFFEYPVFEAVTEIGAVIPQATPPETAATFVPFSPVTYSITPSFGLAPNCSSGPCTSWIERFVTVEEIRGQLSHPLTGSLPELSTNDLLKLLHFDPMTSSNPHPALTDASGRFVPQPVAVGWTHCDSQVQPDVSVTTTQTTSNTQTNTFTSKISQAASETLGVPVINYTPSYTVNDSLTWTYTQNNEVTQMNNTDASAQFGGNGIYTPNNTPSTSCGTVYATNLYLDTVSGSLLFDTPSLDGDGIHRNGVLASFVDRLSEPISDLLLEVTEVNPLTNQLPLTERAATNRQGNLLLNLKPGDYLIHPVGSATNANDRKLNISDSPTSDYVALPSNSLDAAPAGHPSALEFSLTPPSQVFVGDSLDLKAQVRLLDFYGHLASSYNGPVTLSLSPGTKTDAGKLSGLTTVNAHAGVADFTGLSVSSVGNGYRLAASLPKPALTATSEPFDVLPSSILPNSASVNSPVLSIQSVAGFPTPDTASGSFDSADLQLPASVGGAVPVQVAAKGFPPATRIDLFLATRRGDTLLPPVKVGSQTLSNGVALFNVTLPITTQSGGAPLLMLQARAIQLSAFSSTGVLRSPKASVNPFLASSSPLTVQTASTPAPGTQGLSLVDIDSWTAASDSSSAGSLPSLQLPPGASPRDVFVDLAADPQTPDGTPVSVKDQKGQVLSTGTLRNGNARLFLSLPVPPAEGEAPVTTVQAASETTTACASLLTQSGQLGISVDNPTPSVGKPIMVSVVADDSLTGIAGGLFTVNFDPKLLAFVPTDPANPANDFTASGPFASDLVQVNLKNAANGSITIGFANTKGSATGGVLVAFPLTVAADVPATATSLTLSGVELTDPNLDPILETIGNAVVTLGNCVTGAGSAIGSVTPGEASNTIRVSLLRGFIGDVLAAPFAGGLVVSWTTDLATTSALQLTDPKGQTLDVTDTLNQTVHQVKIPNLQPSTIYGIHVTASHPPLDPWMVEVTAKTGTIPGDIDGDGKTRIADATLALRIAVGIIQPTDDQLLAGDTDENGSVSVADVIRILRAAVGL